MRKFYSVIVGLYWVFKNIRANFVNGYRTAQGYFYFKDIAKSLTKESAL